MQLLSDAVGVLEEFVAIKIELGKQLDIEPQQGSDASWLQSRLWGISEEGLS
jgi:hypothetical protein